MNFNLGKCRSADFPAADWDKFVSAERELSGGWGINTGVRQDRSCYAMPPIWDCIHDLTGGEDFD